MGPIGGRGTLRGACAEAIALGWSMSRASAFRRSLSTPVVEGECRVKIAINGAGIAGATLAYWLWRYGHDPVLIEKSSRLRTGGYVNGLLGWALHDRPTNGPDQ